MCRLHFHISRSTESSRSIHNDYRRERERQLKIGQLPVLSFKRMTVCQYAGVTRYSSSGSSPLLIIQQVMWNCQFISTFTVNCCISALHVCHRYKSGKQKKGTCWWKMTCGCVCGAMFLPEIHKVAEINIQKSESRGIISYT